jgi:hypothetical protein
LAASDKDCDVGLNTNGRNACLSGGLGNVITFISIHDDIPDSTGSNELSGGSYARQSVSWAAVAGGERSNSGALTHPIPAGDTAAYYGYWSAVSAGTFYGSAPRVGIGEALSGFGTVDSAGVTGNLIQSAANGLANDMRVALTAVLAESLPTGLNATTIYYIVGVTTNTFQVSLTSGGAAVDITAQGELFWQRVTPELFSAAGNLVTSIGALILSANVI